MDIDKMAEECMKAIKDAVANLKQLNIMVIGKSGVGKSTLINNVFREKMAETGVGRPVTDEIRKISKPDFPLNIYDTPGFELSREQQKSVKEGIIETIEKGFQSKNLEDAIHCIWYCVNVGGNRTFDSSELEWIRELTEFNKKTQVPIIVVLTQAIPKKKAEEMKVSIEKENLDIVKVVPVLAEDMDFDEEYIARAYGIDTLINVMAQVLPTELQQAFMHVQKGNIELKRKMSHACVATAVATAFGEGFVPVPFADAAMLVPTQVGMIAGITTIFGYDISKTVLTAFVSSTIGTAGATVLGKTIVSNILKLIPGVGTVAGGAISGTTAGLITTALGEAYIAIMTMMYKGELKESDLNSEKGKTIMTDLFKTELKKNRNNNN